MTKSNFKKSDMTSFQFHHNYVATENTEKRHQNSVTKFFHFAPPSKFLATPMAPISYIEA